MKPRVLSPAPADTRLPKLSREEFVSRQQHRVNEKYLSQCKKSYCRKYKLPEVNVFENAFDFLNRRILEQIELNKKQRANKRVPTFPLTVKNYDAVYRNSSQALLKMIKSRQLRTDQSEANSDAYVKQVRKLSLQRPGPLRGDGNSGSVLPRLYDYDEMVKLKIQQKQNLGEIHQQVKLIDRKIDRNLRENIVNPFDLLRTEPSYANISFTKNSYLASLNYSDNNPILY